MLQFFVRSAVFIFDMQLNLLPEHRALPKGLLKAPIVGFMSFIDEHSFIHGCFRQCKAWFATSLYFLMVRWPIPRLCGGGTLFSIMTF